MKTSANLFASVAFIHSLPDFLEASVIHCPKVFLLTFYTKFYSVVIKLHPLSILELNEITEYLKNVQCVKQ